MATGKEFVAGLTDFGTIRGTVAPPIQAPPKIQDFFKSGVSLSKTFKDWDEKNAGWTRTLLEYLQREDFKPEISISGGGGGSGNGRDDTTVIFQKVVPKLWVWLPVKDAGTNARRLDYENGEWTGWRDENPKSPPFSINLKRNSFMVEEGPDAWAFEIFPPLGVSKKVTPIVTLFPLELPTPANLNHGIRTWLKAAALNETSWAFYAQLLVDDPGDLPVGNDGRVIDASAIYAEFPIL